MRLHRGQLLICERDLADAWDWHHNRLRRVLDDMARFGMIALERSRRRDLRGTRGTILNYDKYQCRNGCEAGSPEDDGTSAGPVTQDSPRRIKRLATSNPRN